MPRPMSRFAGLDHAVGVEQQRVAAAQHPRDRRRTSAPSIRPRTGPLRLEHLPPAGPGVAQGGRRVPGAADLEVHRSRGRARGGSRWRTPRPSPAAAGTRWPPARNSLGGSAPSSPPKAPDSSSARVPALLALAGHVDDGDLEPVGAERARRRRSRRRTACRRPSAAPLGVPARRAGRGSRPGCRIRSRRSTNIDSPWTPATPRRERRNDVSSTMKQSTKRIDDGEDDPRTVISSWSARSASTGTTSTNTTNHGSCRGPSSRLAEQQRHDQHGHGDVRRRPDQHDADGDGGQRRRAATSVPLPARDQPVDDGARPASLDGRSARSASLRAVMVVDPRASGWHHCTARDRNLRWHCGHQKRLRPASSAVRTVAPADVARHRRCAGRRRPRPRGRRLRGGRPIASGVCSGRTVSIRPVRTPSAMSTTRSSHIARHWPTRSVLPGRQRVDPVPEQHLGAVDVADAGEHRLVHQQVADRRAGSAGSARQATVGVGVVAQRVGPERRDDLVALGRGSTSSQMVAPRRSAYAVGSVCQPRAGPAPHRLRGPAGDVGVHVELADRPRWTCTNRSSGNSTNRCLPQASAPTSTWPSTSAADAGEPALRAARLDHPAAERRGQLVGQPVEGVALRHPVGRARGQRRQLAGPLVRRRAGRSGAACRSSPENGSARKTSTKRVMSSSECIRPPTATTLASLCSRAEQRGLLRPGERAADAGDLVGRDLLAVAGAADHDAEAVQAVGALGGDGLGRAQAEDRVVVDGVVDERAVVDGLVAVLGEPGGQVVLEVESGMVGAEVHAHAAHLLSRAAHAVLAQEPGGLAQQRLRRREHRGVPPEAVQLAQVAGRGHRDAGVREQPGEVLALVAAAGRARR